MAQELANTEAHAELDSCRKCIVKVRRRANKASKKAKRHWRGQRTRLQTYVASKNVPTSVAKVAADVLYSKF